MRSPAKPLTFHPGVPPHEPNPLLHDVRPLVLVAAVMRALTHLIAAVLASLLVWFFQEARLGADVADVRLEASQYKADVQTEKSAGVMRLRQAEGFHNARYDKALLDAGTRERALRAAWDSARNVAERVQRKLDAADQRLAAASREAAIEYGLALSKVFGQCKDRYRELGARADGHASDVATCHAAWPAFGPEPAASQVIQP